MQEIPWAPVHFTADWPTCAEPSFGSTPCLCGTLWCGGPSRQRRIPSNASVADPRGWEKEGPRSALRPMGLAPRQKKSLLPRKPKQLQFFLPLVSGSRPFCYHVPLLPFCCMYVLLLPAFYLPDCTNEVTIHFSLPKLTKTSMTECIIKSMF